MTEDDIRRIAQEEGVPFEAVKAILGQENSKETDISERGAVGKMQVMPKTFNAVLPGGNINDPEDNLRAGVRYLKQGLAATGGDFQKAAQYYYAGPDYATKTGKSPGQKYQGLSIEDYGKQAAAKLGGVKPVDVPLPDMPEINIEGMSSGSPPFNPDVVSPDTATVSKVTATLPDTSDEIFAQISQLGKEANAAAAKIQTGQADLSERIKGNMTKQVAAARSQGDLAATVILEKNRQDTQKATESAQTLSNLGINTSDSDALIARISTRMQDDKKIADSLRGSIEDRMANTLFDNPAQWILDRFTLPGDIERHNQVIRRIAADKAYVDKAASVASEISAVNATKYAAMSAKEAQASADIQRSLGESKALALEDNLLRTDYNTQVQTFNVINHRLSTLNSLLSIEQSRENKLTADQAKLAKKQAQELDDQRVLLASRTLGYEIKTRAELEKIPNKNFKEAVDMVMANGLGPGADPYIARTVLNSGNYAAMPTQVKQQRDLLEATYRQAAAKAMVNPQWKTADDKQKKGIISSEMNAILSIAQDNPTQEQIAPGSSVNAENPYKIWNFATASKDPEVKNSKLWKILDEHTKALPNQPLTDSMIQEFAYLNIGKVYPDPVSAAKDVAAYYKNGIEFNNDTHKFSKFGMPEQLNYRVGGVDYSDSAAIAKKYLARMRKEYFQGVVTGKDKASELLGPGVDKSKAQKDEEQRRAGIGNAGVFGNFQPGQETP